MSTERIGIVQTSDWPGATPAAGFRGVNINLDQAADRRRLMEDEFRKFGLDGVYARLPAVDGRLLNQKQSFSPYAEACFRSHTAAVDLARQAGSPVHIIEDDTLLSRHVAFFFEHARHSGILDRHDVVFLDMWVQPNLEHIERWENLYRQSSVQARSAQPLFPIHDMRDFPCKAASSYAVSPRGAQKLYDCLKAELDRGPSVPVDVFIGQLGLEGRLSVGVAVPFVTTVDSKAGSISSIQLRLRPGVIQSFLLLRSAFFIEADIEGRIIPTLDAAIATTRNEIFAGLRRLLASRPRG